MNLLRSIEQWESDATVSVWDLGLTSAETELLKTTFARYEVKVFDFSLHAEHVDIHVNAGEYAWKPIILEAELKTADRLVLWLDAGVLITKPLTWIRRFVRQAGFFSPYSRGSIAEWTHPLMCQRFNLDPPQLRKRNLSGGVVGLDPLQPQAQALVAAWAACARDVDCIAPPGSHRLNHRQDQSALSVLAYTADLAPQGRYADCVPCLGLLLHQDVE